MLKTILFIGLVVIFIGSSILGIILKGLSIIKKHSSLLMKRRLKMAVKLSVTSLVVAIFLVIVSQAQVYTPDIPGEQSISELIKVNINGTDQWLSIRGEDKNNPIILFLAGGPGGSQIGAVRRNLKSLEASYVVVNWEQPGSGKSFGSVNTENLTPKQYIKDGSEVTQYLKERFNRDKIYLIGESWGSALGIS